MARTKVTQKAEAIERLHALVKPGDTVYTVLPHVNRIDLYAIIDNEMVRLTGYAAKATGLTYSEKHEALILKGCGMDMGFEAVYRLGKALWPKGFACIDSPFKDGEPRQYLEDGGYALRHQWIG